MEGKKFDLRCYALVVSTNPYIVLFKHGIVRRTINEYNIEDGDISTHLSNLIVQRQHPDFKEVEWDVLWRQSELEYYLQSHYNRTREQIEEIYDQQKSLIAYTFLSARDYIWRQRGVSQLFGIDVLYDENFRPHLLEVNCWPVMDVTEVKYHEVTPVVVKNFIETAVYLNDNYENLETLARDESRLLLKCPDCYTLINSVTGFNYVDHLLQKKE